MLDHAHALPTWSPCVHSCLGCPICPYMPYDCVLEATHLIPEASSGLPRLQPHAVCSHHECCM